VEAKRKFREIDGTDMPSDLEREARLRARGEMPVILSFFAVAYERDRRVAGTMTDPAAVLLQVRHGRVNLLGQGSTASHTPLDLDKPRNSGTRGLSHVEGGVIPLGQVFVVERIEMEARCGVSGNRMREGGLNLRLPRAQVLNLRDLVAPRLKLVYQGRQLVRPGEARQVLLEARNSVASAQLRGRFVARDEADAIERIPFRAVEGESEGFLQDGPILIQILVPHAGGNAHAVHLDGSRDGRIRNMSRLDLWPGPVDLRTLQDSTAHTVGCGPIPPGHAFVITRIDYRVRLDPKKSNHSEFGVMAARKSLVQWKASQGTDHAGTWEGEVRVESGKERTFQVSCSYFAMVEARITGRLVRDGEQ
jgi:hypothetical protein